MARRANASAAHSNTSRAGFHDSGSDYVVNMWGISDDSPRMPSSRRWHATDFVLASLVVVRVLLVGEPAQTYRAVAQTHSGPVVFRYFVSHVCRVY
jgi:hypothetical protein